MQIVMMMDVVGVLVTVRDGRDFRHQFTVPYVRAPAADQTADTGLDGGIVSVSGSATALSHRPSTLRRSKEGTWILFPVLFAVVETARVRHSSDTLLGGVTGLADRRRPKAVQTTPDFDRIAGPTSTPAIIGTGRAVLIKTARWIDFEVALLIGRRHRRSKTGAHKPGRWQWRVE